MTRVLVTGGTGFLGAALVRSLVADGHSVRVLDNNSRGAHRRLGDAVSDVDMVEADIRDADAVAKACRDIDTVAHLAFVNGTETFYSNPGLVLDVGVRGMLSILDGCAANDVSSMLLVSSSETYQRADRIPTPEDVPLVVPDPRNPRFSYGGAKILCELLALHGNGYRPAQVRIVRPHNVYGPDMGEEHVIPQLALRLAALDRAHAGRDPIALPIRGDGTQTRAFIHVDDFTSALRLVMDQGPTDEITHIGSREEVTIATLAHTIADAFGRHVSLVPSEPPAGETDRRCPDITRLEALGFVPNRSFTEGVGAVARWYRDTHTHTTSADGVLE